MSLDAFIKSLKLPPKRPPCWYRDLWETLTERLRDLVPYRVRWWWSDQIDTRIRPRQRWLTRQVPRSWRDKDSLIEDLLFAMVVHFVSPEGENALDAVHWEPADEAMLREIYAWATVGRAAQYAAIEGAYPTLPPPLGQLASYDEVNRLATLLQETDTRYLVWLVQNRGRLWC